MDLEDLRIFCAVVDAGGITRAAERLHRVQSNVTTRIRQLEQDLNCALFLREGKKLLLTPQGRTLLGYARRLLELAEQARTALQQNLPHGRLRLGSMESTAAARLPQVLAGFYQRYPEVKLELRTAATARLLHEVLERQLDCALVSGPVQDTRLHSQVLFYERLLLVTPLNYPAINPKSVASQLTLLTFEAGCAYRLRLEAWLAANYCTPHTIIEMASYHAMVGCVAAGMGVALVPESLLDTLPAAHSVARHPLPEPFSHSATELVWRADTQNPAVTELARLAFDLVNSQQCNPALRSLNDALAQRLISRDGHCLTPAE